MEDVENGDLINENGDLINTDSDDQQVEKVVREIVAKWDYQRKNYFI